MSNLMPRPQFSLAIIATTFLCAASVLAQSTESKPLLLPDLFPGPSTATPIPPYLNLQYSTLTASGNTITISQVPVVLATGTVLKNVTIQLSVDSNGNISLSSGFPQATLVPAPIVSSFVAGTYLGPESISNSFITVSGPGTTPGGATEWTLNTPSTSSCYTVPTTATWYVGPIASNPLASRLSAAGITSTVWSYGVTGASSCATQYWANNTLIGVSQVGNTITIVSFTYSGGDHSTPVSQITYTLVP